MNVGEAIKTLRVRRQITQKFLAERCGITQGFLSLVERGDREPGFDLVEKISETLGVPPQLILLLACEKYTRGKRYSKPLRKIALTLDELLHAYSAAC
ncbi:MAG: helix-turn-helix transcriptional regulator [Candidatus Omnitrophica bacterium]|nr:helix-turn-helix transcriptional regulator [Candidatus Omnitrophota bacterium]